MPMPEVIDEPQETRSYEGIKLHTSHGKWWAHKGLNLGPWPCKDPALPLSYAPDLKTEPGTLFCFYFPGRSISTERPRSPLLLSGTEISQR